MEKIENDEVKTGLVIADTMRDTFGSSWGFPHAFLTKVMLENSQALEFKDGDMTKKRDLEAHHSAVRCFTAAYPLWTLDEVDYSLQDLLLAAQMEKLGDLNALRVF